MIVCKICKECGGWIQMPPIGEIKIDPFPRKSEEIDGCLCDCSKEEGDDKEK